MTENRRITLNTLATYGRSLFALVCSLFTSRWILMALGQSDYGLFGVVGGMMAFISFFNSVLGGSIGRFYAFSVGAQRIAQSSNALEECRKWFNTALSIHSIIPAILIAVGYPIGVWAIRNWLTVPVDRIEDCIWIFRISCVSCFIGMVNVPFFAMFTAKQNIAELTLYQTLSTALHFAFVGFMVTHPGNWFLKYAVFGCLISSAPQVWICFRACRLYPECRIDHKYLFLRSYFKKLGAFAGWQMLGSLCGLLRGQGMIILINKFFGPRVNASMTVATKVDTQSSTLASAMIGAFAPAITNACGARDYERMRSLAYRSGKFGVLLSLLFVLPLSLEIREIVRLWLKTPPPYTAGLCLCMMVQHLAYVLTTGHMIAINASGRIREYYIGVCSINILTLPIAACFLWLGKSPYYVGYTLVAMMTLNSMLRVVFARKLVEMSAWHWLRWSVVPLSLCLVFSTCAGLIPRLFLAPGVSRILATGFMTETMLLPTAWFVVLDADERNYVRNRIHRWWTKRG